jgi:hypothetical protein
MNEPLNIQDDMPRNWRVLSKPISFDEARERVAQCDKRDGERTDVVLPLRALTARDYGGGSLNLARPGKHPTPPRQHAFGQLCGLIKAPAKYLRELPADLALKCLNHGLADADDEVTLRMAGSEIRGIVSPRFGKFDNEPVMEMLANELNLRHNTHDMEVVAMATGNVTNLRIVFPEKVKGPDGHDVKVGFDLRNSEVGGASLLLRAVSYRLICTNGQVWQDTKDEARWRHVGSPDRLVDAFGSAIPGLIESSKTLSSRMERAHDTVVTLDELQDSLGRLEITRPQQLVSYRETLVEAGHIGPGDERDHEETIKALPEDTNVTLWHAMNGITAAARQQPTEIRLQMESQASRLAA